MNIPSAPLSTPAAPRCTVGGHYFEGMADDPWTTNYESCSVGSSTTSLSLDDSTLDHDEFVLAPRYTARNEMDEALNGNDRSLSRGKS
jgi:hypothetical protein